MKCFFFSLICWNKTNLLICPLIQTRHPSSWPSAEEESHRWGKRILITVYMTTHCSSIPTTTLMIMLMTMTCRRPSRELSSTSRRRAHRHRRRNFRRHPCDTVAYNVATDRIFSEISHGKRHAHNNFKFPSRDRFNDW